MFQQFNLVARLPVIVNVLAGTLHRIPLWRSLLRWFTSSEIAQGVEALKRVGIEECWAQRASTLSGGQQQRAAIARALVQGAKVILADEPIASLDPESSRKVMDILARVNREDQCTAVVSLHQVNVAMKYCPRTVALHKGRVVYDGPSIALTPALLRELYGAASAPPPFFRRFNSNPRKNPMIKKLLIGIASAALITSACAQEMKELNFGIISTESSQNLKSDW